MSLRRRNLQVAAAKTLGASAAALFILLHRRTRYRSIRAEHAAVAALGPEDSTATLAVVDYLTGGRRHRLALGVPALGAGEDRFHCRHSAPFPWRVTGSIARHPVTWFGGKMRATSHSFPSPLERPVSAFFLPTHSRVPAPHRTRQAACAAPAQPG